MSTRLEEIKARAEKATPGPWHHDDGAIWAPGPVTAVAYDVREDSAAFIAAARSDVPWLLQEVERLRRALKAREFNSVWQSHPKLIMECCDCGAKEGDSHGRCGDFDEEGNVR